MTTLLVNRISQFLKHRPPSTSELRPLNGLDPTTHAEVCLVASYLDVKFHFSHIQAAYYYLFQLALKDADKLTNLRSDSVKSYILKANALILVRKVFSSFIWFDSSLGEECSKLKF